MQARQLILGLAAAAVLLVETAARAPCAAAEPAWAQKVTAVYKLRMAGVELGTFNFNSTVNGQDYALAGHGKLSWGMGFYSYNGNFASTGKVDGERVRPSSYAYDWRVSRKAGGVKLGFAAGGVQSVEIVPPHVPGPDAVPLLPDHLKAVFDPMSAMLAMSRLRAGDSCDRKIAVFEGKQRLDIVLTPHRQEKIVEPRPSGQPVTAHVCRARYVPVAGHRPNREQPALVKADGIEVALRPVPSVGLLIPYKLTIPTSFGTAVLTAQRVDITGMDKRQIALVH